MWTRGRIAVRTQTLALAGLLWAAAAMGAPVGSAETTPRTLVILGASYAHAWGEPALPGFDQTINRGLGGDETVGMLQRFDADVVAARPQTVLIWGLVNNITRSKPERREAAKQAAKDHYAEMLRRARAAGIEVILATEVPWTDGQGWLHEFRGWIGELRGKTSYARRISADVGEVNAYLRTLAAREGCRLLDFERVFAREDGTRKPEYAAEDGSHINRAGYAALTAHAQKELRRAR